MPTTLPTARGFSGSLLSTRPPETSIRLERIPAGEKEAPQQTALSVLQIPEGMWNRIEEQITQFVDDELTACDTERGPMMEKFIRWREAYNALFSNKPKNWPIYNSSNITAPLAKEHIHTIVGQLVQSTVSVDPPFIFEDLNPDWEPFVDPIQRFMTLAAERDLGMEEAETDAIIEAAILGTAITEVAHWVDERKVYRYTADGKRVYPETVVMQDGPREKQIPIGAFWIRMHERDPETSRWCAKELSLSDQELLEKQAIGKFYGVQRIFDFYDSKEDDVREAENRKLNQESNATSLRPTRHKIFEVFASYDVDGDDRFEEVKLYYHRESRTFIGRQFLSAWDGKRGFVKWSYFPRTDRFYDEGLVEMLEQLQIAISAIINRRADNATLANLKMIIKRKLLKTLQPGDPLYSGKIIEVNDIWNDLREFSMSEIYPSTINEEQILRSIADRLSGMNEAAAGAGTPVSRTTAAAQLALLQEQRNRIGLTVSSIRKSRKQVGQRTLSLYSQFGVNGKALAWMGERGRPVEAIFRLPRRVTELGLALSVTSPTSTTNKQVKRENMIGMFNLITQMYERLLPLVQMLAPESLPEVALGLVKSARHFMEDTLETFDEISDPASVLEGLITLERVLPKPENLGGLESFERAEEAADIADRLSRMENLYREAEGTRERNARVRAGDERASRITPPQGNGGRPQAGNIPGGDTLFRS